MLASVEWFQLLIINIQFQLFPKCLCYYYKNQAKRQKVEPIRTQALCALLSGYRDLGGVSCVHAFKSLARTAAET